MRFFAWDGLGDMFGTSSCRSNVATLSSISGAAVHTPFLLHTGGPSEDGETGACEDVEIDEDVTVDGDGKTDDEGETEEAVAALVHGRGDEGVSGGLPISMDDTVRRCRLFFLREHLPVSSLSNEVARSKVGDVRNLFLWLHILSLLGHLCGSASRDHLGTDHFATIHCKLGELGKGSSRVPCMKLLFFTLLPPDELKSPDDYRRWYCNVPKLLLLGPGDDQVQVQHTLTLVGEDVDVLHDCVDTDVAAALTYIHLGAVAAEDDKGESDTILVWLVCLTLAWPPLPGLSFSDSSEPTTKTAAATAHFGLGVVMAEATMLSSHKFLYLLASRHWNAGICLRKPKEEEI